MLATEFDELVPRISPDGRWMAYLSTESGHDEIYVRQFPSALMRIRRSLRPKRIAVISEAFDPLLSTLASGDTGAELLLDAGHPFGLDGAGK